MYNDITIQLQSHGHWKISIEKYGKTLSTITTNSRAIDDYNSDPDEKIGKKFRKKQGHQILKEEILDANKN